MPVGAIYNATNVSLKPLLIFHLSSITVCCVVNYYLVAVHVRHFSSCIFVLQYFFTEDLITYYILGSDEVPGVLR